jgi:hypothetical protein
MRNPINPGQPVEKEVWIAVCMAIFPLALAIYGWIQMLIIVNTYSLAFRAVDKFNQYLSK